DHMDAALRLSGQRTQHVGYRDRIVAAAEGDEGDGKGQRQQHEADRDRAQVYALGDGAAEKAQHPDGPSEIHAARGGERAHSPLTRRRRARRISTGAPTKAVTMPTCNSPGRMTRRPTMSALISSMGASTRVKAKIQRWSGPTIQRATWGTI